MLWRYSFQCAEEYKMYFSLYWNRNRNRWVSCLPRTKQPDKYLSSVFESNEHDCSSPVLKLLHDRQRYYVYNTFTKQINFKAEPLMFLNLASCMKLLFFILEQYLHKADRTFLSSASILKSFANGHFLKVVIDIYSFFTIRKRIKSLANTV